MLRRSLPLAAAVLAVALPLQELAVRFALPEFDPARQVQFRAGDGERPTLAIADARLRQVKNTGDFNVLLTINHHGLRDRNDVAEATADDWVVVGDSFGFGWGVDADDRYSEQLERRLPGHRVFNVSIPGGLGAADTLLNYGHRLGGDIHRVIVQITVERDIHRYGAAAVPEPGTTPPPPPVASSAQTLLAVKEWLTERSELYFLLTTRIHSMHWLEKLAVRAGLVRPNLAAIHHPPFDSVAVESTADRAAQVVAPYAEHAILLIPARALWSGDTAERALADRIHRSLVTALQARHLRVVDMRNRFEAGGNPLSYHFANDGHWSPRGHALAGEALAEAVAHSSPPAGGR
jgi:hypothetical protein